MDQGTILKPDIPGINDPDYVTTSASLVHLDRRMFVDFPICFASTTSTPLSVELSISTLLSPSPIGGNRNHAACRKQGTSPF